jgi:hypothetical protein
VPLAGYNPRIILTIKRREFEPLGDVKRFERSEAIERLERLERVHFRIIAAASCTAWTILA